MSNKLTVSQAIAVKQCCASTIYRWIKQKRINASKENKKWQIICDEKWDMIQTKRNYSHATLEETIEQVTVVDIIEYENIRLLPLETILQKYVALNAKLFRVLKDNRRFHAKNRKNEAEKKRMQAQIARKNRQISNFKYDYSQIEDYKKTIIQQEGEINELRNEIIALT